MNSKQSLRNSENKPFLELFSFVLLLIATTLFSIVFIWLLLTLIARKPEVVYSDLLNTSSASARTFISFMRPDFVKEKILLYNLLILRITSILKIMLVIDNPYGSR